MRDLECPYCGHEQDVCHDDGFGYAEDRRHEVRCEGCGKKYVFTTAVSFAYYPSEAECLNDGNHAWKAPNTVPRRYSRWQCQHCDATKPMTPEELARLEGGGNG